MNKSSYFITASMIERELSRLSSESFAVVFRDDVVAIIDAKGRERELPISVVQLSLDDLTNDHLKPFLREIN